VRQGLGRSFAFERWRDADLAAWRSIYDEAEARAAAGSRQAAATVRQRPPSGRHRDRQAGASSPPASAGKIQLTHGDARDYVPPFAPGLVVTNPPYGDAPRR
jgi:23S rRNA G2445 N2-methylase RlmL